MRRLIFSVIILFGAFTICEADNDWKEKNPSPHPIGRYLFSMSYIANGKVLLFGGNITSTANETDETWIYDLSTNSWSQKIVDGPVAREEHDMAYIGEDKVLLFGGDAATGYQSDTWIYDLSESTWHEMNPINHPPVSQNHKLAYLGDDKVLYFLQNKTWVYDLSENNWTDQNPAIYPSGNSSPAMCYIGQSKVLLFGGGNDETWIFDYSSNTWTQMNPTISPSARSYHALSYIGNNRALLFGGSTASGYANDTWIYDYGSNNWSQDLNAINPSPRYSHQIAETSLNGSNYLVLFGGYDGTFGSSGTRFDDTWTFGGGDYSLPIFLNSYTATAGNGQITLKWITQSEQKNLGFIIERSQSSTDEFDEIASYINYPQLKGQGNSNSRTSYFFADQNLPNGIAYYYKLIDVDFNGIHTAHGPISGIPNANGVEIEKKAYKATHFSLEQNYPNPFNPSTTIRFEIPVNSHSLETVRLSIYNTQGQAIRNLYFGKLADGVYDIVWDGTDNSHIQLPSGVYLVLLKAGFLTKSKKMLLVR